MEIYNFIHLDHSRIPGRQISQLINTGFNVLTFPHEMSLTLILTILSSGPIQCHGFLDQFITVHHLH